MILTLILWLLVVLVIFTVCGLLTFGLAFVWCALDAHVFRRRKYREEQAWLRRLHVGCPHQ